MYLGEHPQSPNTPRCSQDQAPNIKAEAIRWNSNTTIFGYTIDPFNLKQKVVVARYDRITQSHNNEVEKRMVAGLAYLHQEERDIDNSVERKEMGI